MAIAVCGLLMRMFTDNLALIGGMVIGLLFGRRLRNAPTTRIYG